MSITYNSDLLKSTGLVQETLVLLNAYVPGQTKEAFSQEVLSADLLGKATQRRVDDIIRSVFFKRYIAPGEEVAGALNVLSANQVGMDVLTQLFFVYTSRANLILQDFVRSVYWLQVRNGQTKIRTSDPVDFIREAIREGRIAKVWAESTIRKVSEHIIACLIDFKLIEKNKAIRAFLPLDASVNYLLHEMHFRGLADNQILRQPDWEALGLSVEEVVRRIERLSIQGHFIAQYSGELLKISWMYSTLTDAARGISRA